MKLKHLLIINGTLAIIAGLAFALEWGPMAEIFSNTFLPPVNETPHIVWVGGSFTRMFGITLFGWGLLILLMHNVSTQPTRRGITIAMLTANTFFGFMAFLQQIAIWNTPAGWITVGISALFALGYGYFFAKDLLLELVPAAQPESETGDNATYNLERIRYITQNYNTLQGLRFVPIGLWWLAFSAGWLGKQGNCTYSLPAALLALALMWVIGAYYKQHFGSVKPADVKLGKITLHPTSPVWLLVGLAVWLITWIAINIVIELEVLLKPQVSLSGLTMAAVITMFWLIPACRPRLHYLVTAILIAGISILPMAGVSPSAMVLYPYPWTMFNIAMGLFFFLGGLFDHLLLVRAFKALPEEVNHE